MGDMTRRGRRGEMRRTEKAEVAAMTHREATLIGRLRPERIVAKRALEQVEAFLSRTLLARAI